MKRWLLLMTAVLLAGPAWAEIDCREGSPDYPACLFKKSAPKPGGMELSPPSRPTIPTFNMQQLQRTLDTKSFESGKIVVN
jgi:hypothetical protein